MASNEFDQEPEKRGTEAAAKGEKPGWANGLRQLYDSVVDEPLPDTFKDLLAQLDEDDDSEEDKKAEKPSSGAEGGA